MHKMPAASWARINPRLWSCRTAAASKIVRRPTKASARRLTVLKPLCLAAVVLLIVTLTTAALADDDKTYVGAACRAVDPASAGLRATDGALINQSRVEQTWICPVVRDHMDKDPGFARITVQEDGTNQVKCEFEARGPKGTSQNFATHSNRKQDIISTSPLQLVVVYTWGEGDSLALNGVPDHGYYFFRCVVPGRTDQQTSGVVTYKVSED